MKKLNRHPKYWLSGEKAKKFRRNLSTYSSGRGKAIIQSHKFPLMVEPLNAAARNTLRQEYYLSSAIAENTLFHYFIAVHLSGFIMFSSEGAAEIYNNKLILRQSRLNKDLKEALGVEGEPAALLLQELKKEIRKDNKTKEKVIAKIERIPSFKAKEKETLLDQFVQELATEIADNKLWKKSQEQERCEAIITAGKKLGLTFTLPTLQPYKHSILWSGQTAEYLKNADTSAAGLEFAMHQLVSLAAHIVSGAKEKVTADDIKIVLLSDTGNYNALSSFFNPNKGMRLFAETKEKQLSEQLGIGKCESKKLQNIRNIAQTLLRHEIDFAKHQSLFGGNIASGVTNYWKRLEELQKGLESITCTVAPEISKTLKQLEQEQEKFAGIIAEYEQIAVSTEHLQALINELIQQKNTAENALECLMGKSNKIAGKREIECIEKFNDCFEESKGLFIQLAEKLRIKAEDKKGEYGKAREKFNALEFLLPPKSKQQDEIEDGSRYLKRKINRYSGAKIYELSEIQETLKAEYAKLKNLQQARAKHWKKITKQYPIDIIAARVKTERQRIENDKSKNINAHDPLTLACRNILQRLADAVKKLGNRNTYVTGELLFEKHNVFANEKIGALFFKENKGRIYASAFANYSHDGLALGDDFDKDIRKETQKFITAFFAWVETIQQDNNAEAIRDAALAEQAMYALSCSGVSQDVAATLAQPDETCELEIPVGLQQALKKETVNSGELGRLFNAYASEINGLCARLVRRQIIVKSRLQHIGDKNFYYLPKADRDFTPPQKLFNNDGEVQGDSPFAQMWRILQTDKTLFVDDNPAGKTAKIKAAALPAAIELLEDKLPQDEKRENTLRACLRQIPHGWYYKNSEYPVLNPASEKKHPRLLDESNKLQGLRKLEGGIAIKKITKADSDSARYLRLSGTSCHKGWLDNVLLGRASFGDSSLIIEEEYQQKYDKKGPVVKEDKTRVEIAAVFKTLALKHQQQEFPLKENFIAIDLGERGIGYSVYAVPKAGNNGKLQQPIISGHVVLPILRQLMKRVDNYRRRQQPRQRFQSNINTALQQLREVTIGELAGTIDGLIKRYKAFPVFESSVGGFESGGRALKMVYGSILHLYSFSDVDAHKTKRQNHWQATTAPTWKHPILKRLDRKGEPELNLFPGVVVSPMGTSQICSVCEKNPLKLIYDAEEKYPMQTDSDGILSLDEGKVKLYIYGKEKQAKYSEKENPLPGRRGVLKNHSFKNKKELLTQVKKMLRHKPLSQKSKDTSQASYLSPFVDTQEKLALLSREELKQRHCFSRNGLVFMHADVNAAINIGKKWWNTINTPETKSTAKK